MKKILICLFTGIAMLLGMQLVGAQLRASAADVVLYDEGSRLTSAEYDECYAALREASDKTGMNVGVILGTSYRSDSAIEAAAKEAYLGFFDSNSDGLLYYLDLKGQNAYDYIVTRGMGQFYYTNSSSNDRIEEIFGRLDPYLYPAGKENVHDALLTFADLVVYYYNAGVPDRYYYYDDQTRMYYHLENGEVIETSHKPYTDWGAVFLLSFGGFLIGGIAALITYFSVKGRYKFKYALTPTAYVNKKGVVYHQQLDNFVRQHTHRIHIESGGGGGGGFHGGGGHSSGGFGGGGHHR